MIRIHDLPHEAALAATQDGDFPSTITGGANVAIIMTQDWCTDWMLMRHRLGQLAKTDTPADRDIDVYVFVYNKVDFFEQFMTHKEEVYGNHLIPYVRYYSNGALIGESNQLNQKQFLARFDP